MLKPSAAQTVSMINPPVNLHVKYMTSELTITMITVKLNIAKGEVSMIIKGFISVLTITKTAAISIDQYGDTG